MGITYLEFFRKRFRVEETELVTHKREECDLMPDDLRGWEGSREVLSKETLNGGLCDQYQDIISS